MGFFRRMIGRETSTPTAEDYAVAGATPPQPPQAAAEELAASEPTQEPTELAEPPAPPPNPLLGDLRKRHFYCIGKSGTGKTTLLKTLLVENFVAGDGCAFLDPHGDAALDLLGYVPDDRVGDVIYFDPTDPQTYAFNLLALPYPPHKLAEDIVSAFKLLFSISDAPRLEHILRNALLTLISDRDRQPHSLKDLQRILRNPDYRAEIIEHIQNDDLREFWDHEFKPDHAGSILNKFSALLAPMSDMERILSSTDNAIDFPTMMDNGKIFIANLSKGKLGDEPSRLLGALLATAIQQAALARADRPVADRRQFFFYVDEFQNYAVASFSTILSEARKYNLALTLANQTLKQIPDDIRDAIFGNVALLAAFQVSSDDSTRMAKEMTSTQMIFRNIQSGETFTAAQFNNHLRGVLPQIYDALDKNVERAIDEQMRSISGDDQTKRAANVARMIERARVTRHDGSSPKPGTLHALHWQEFQTLKYLTDALTSRDLRPEHLHQVLAEDFGTGEKLRDYFEMREETTPTAQDFLNLKPLHAYLRVERAENVSPLQLEHFSEPPSEQRRNEIIERMHATNKRTPAPPPQSKAAPPVKSEGDLWQ